MCGGATAPVCYDWANLASHYGWWQLANESLHDCAWTTLAKLWVTGCDVDMVPLAKVMPKNGFGFALAMGLDGAVWRSGSD